MEVKEAAEEVVEEMVVVEEAEVGMHPSPNKSSSPAKTKG